MSEEAIDLFEYRYSSIVGDIHIMLQDTAKDLAIPIYDVPKSYYELLEFFMGYSSALDSMTDEPSYSDDDEIEEVYTSCDE